MKYELAKQLKEAGFPQGCTGNGYFVDNQGVEYKGGEHWKQFNYVPTLSELIEACGEYFYSLRRDYRADNGKPFFWAEINGGVTFDGVASKTPEEAVARLFICLNSDILDSNEKPTKKRN